jgi:hypothetical protein
MEYFSSASEKGRHILQKLNCWEYKNCGREPGGLESGRYGVCPASTSTEVDGLNHGKNGGRICWAIAGTFINSKVMGKYASHKFSCVNCDFFKLVSDEQGVDNFEIVTPVQMTYFKKKQETAGSQFVEKRSSSRFSTDLIAVFSCGNTDYAGTVTNISETGMFISVRDISFPNNSRFDMKLSVGEKYLNLPVRMCRLTISPDLDDGMGTEIINPPHEYLILIDKLRKSSPQDIERSIQ